MFRSLIGIGTPVSGGSARALVAAGLRHGLLRGGGLLRGRRSLGHRVEGADLLAEAVYAVQVVVGDLDRRQLAARGSRRPARSRSGHESASRYRTVDGPGARSSSDRPAADPAERSRHLAVHGRQAARSITLRPVDSETGPDRLDYGTWPAYPAGPSARRDRGRRPRSQPRPRAPFPRARRPGRRPAAAAVDRPRRAGRGGGDRRHDLAGLAARGDRRGPRRHRRHGLPLEDRYPAVQVTTAQRRTRRRLFLLRPAGYVALHRRAIPGSDSVIDHLVIGPGGVFALDSERWDRRLPVRTPRPAACSTTARSARKSGWSTPAGSPRRPPAT